MRYAFIAFALFFCSIVSSQTTSSSKLVDIISKADTVNFVADNSGCFHAYVLEVKMCKQKSGGRTLLLKTDTGIVNRTLSAKKYKAFISNYKTSSNYFAKHNKQTCTSVTEFNLYCKTKSGSRNSSGFRNLNCNAVYNPEFFLQDLLREDQGTK